MIEWFFDSCMQVVAALGVKDYDRESIDLGIKRKDIAALMLASRNAEIQKVLTAMDVDASWQECRAAYPILLKYCLKEFLNDK